jgi:hypothetical protein
LLLWHVYFTGILFQVSVKALHGCALTTRVRFLVY